MLSCCLLLLWGGMGIADPTASTCGAENARTMNLSCTKSGAIGAG